MSTLPGRDHMSSSTPLLDGKGKGVLGLKKNTRGRFFFFKPLELDLPTYVIRHVPIYGNVTSSS